MAPYSYTYILLNICTDIWIFRYYLHIYSDCRLRPNVDHDTAQLDTGGTPDGKTSVNTYISSHLHLGVDAMTAALKETLKRDKFKFSLLTCLKVELHFINMTERGRGGG